MFCQGLGIWSRSTANLFPSVKSRRLFRRKAEELCTAKHGLVRCLSLPFDCHLIDMRMLPFLLADIEASVCRFAWVIFRAWACLLSRWSYGTSRRMLHRRLHHKQRTHRGLSDSFLGTEAWRFGSCASYTTFTFYLSLLGALVISMDTLRSVAL